MSGIGVLVMAIVCLDLWFIVKENPDKITPYYLQMTKEQIKKAEEESERKADRRSKRAKQKEDDMKKMFNETGNTTRESIKDNK